MALTQPEIFEHIGRMLDHSINNDISVGLGTFDLGHRSLIALAKDYRLNGTSGTQAERGEAMRTAIRKLFAKMTGLNATSNAHQLEHWVNDHEPGESGEYV